MVLPFLPPVLLRRSPFLPTILRPVPTVPTFVPTFATFVPTLLTIALTVPNSLTSFAIVVLTYTTTDMYVVSLFLSM